MKVWFLRSLLVATISKLSHNSSDAKPKCETDSYSSCFQLIFCQLQLLPVLDILECGRGDAPLMVVEGDRILLQPMAQHTGASQKVVEDGSNSSDTSCGGLETAHHQIKALKLPLRSATAAPDFLQKFLRELG